MVKYRSSLTFGSLFAGIRGFDEALRRCGIEQMFAVEIDSRCNSVGRRHFPDEEQHDDVTTFSARSTRRRPYIIGGGFPCQDLSLAGRRDGLAGERSGLWWEFRRIIAQFRPCWVLIENVPGLRSSNGGRDLGAILGALGKLGYRWAYRSLDSQYYGVAQRRERVFVVGSLGDGPHPAEVLFDAESLPGNSPPSREARTGVTPILEVGARTGGRTGDLQRDGIGVGQPGDPMFSLQASKQHGVAAPLDTKPYADHEAKESGQIIPVDTTQLTNSENRSNPQPGDPCHPIAAAAHPPAIAYQCHGSSVGPMGTLRQGNGNETGGVPFVWALHSENSNAGHNGVSPKIVDRARALDANGGFSSNQGGNLVQDSMAVRRLTPTECERLQGFPDGWTAMGHDGTPISDSARYRMLGNAITVNVVEEIGRRLVQAINKFN